MNRLDARQLLPVLVRMLEEAETGSNHFVFLTRDGEIDLLSTSETDQGVWTRLKEEARASSGGAYFEVLGITAGGPIDLS